MGTVTGVVEWHGDSKFGGQSVKVDGKYFNSKFDIGCQKGDTVEFDDGGKNYCQKLRVTDSGAPVATSGGSGKAPAASGFPIHPLARERAIIRQNALGNAVQFLAGPDGGVAGAVLEVLAVARQFEAWTSGDMDAAEAAEAKERLLKAVE